MLTIRRRDPSHNMARFYAVGLQGDLLDGCSVVREWGRIGRPGRVKTDLHGALARAQTTVEGLAATKWGRGYC
jgi:predicted DNA-binding WGR domain protein